MASNEWTFASEIACPPPSAVLALEVYFAAMLARGADLGVYSWIVGGLKGAGVALEATL